MKRKFSKTSSTWQLFEAFFLDAGGRDSQGQYIKYKCTGKGQAINLAIGLNTCNMQWHEETGVDKTTNRLSARPMQDSQGDWWLELCESTKNNRQSKRMADVLQNVLTMQNTGVLVKPIAAQHSTDPNEPGISPFEKIRRLALATETGANPARTALQEPAPAPALVPDRPPVDDSLFESMFDLHLPKPKEKDE